MKNEKKLINQLEPNSLIDNFLENPPEGFISEVTQDGVPVFFAKFDLLTTIDPQTQKKLTRLPFYRWWGKWLRPTVCFVGTTVSEYALLSDSVDERSLALNLKKNYARRHPFLIVKDVPKDSPLQNNHDNLYSSRFASVLKSESFIEVEGQALAWVPVDYRSTDDYLSRLSASRRKNFRRKLKKQDSLEIKELDSGAACFFDPNVLKTYYQLYLNVYDQSEIHFDLLSAEFFTRLLQDRQTKAKIFTYAHQGQLIGYNICFIINGMLIDKYIGFAYPAARDFNLYFISWFYNLDFARREGLTHYVAGWTDPEVKASLGAEFTFTQHLVYVRNPLLRLILKKMTALFESDNNWYESHNRKK